MTSKSWSGGPLTLTRPNTTCSSSASRSRCLSLTSPDASRTVEIPCLSINVPSSLVDSLIRQVSGYWPTVADWSAPLVGVGVCQPVSPWSLASRLTNDLVFGYRHQSLVLIGPRHSILTSSLTVCWRSMNHYDPSEEWAPIERQAGKRQGEGKK